MRWALRVAFVWGAGLLTTVVAAAQINGVPPSVTSLGPNNVISAPAPSVTSLGPRGLHGSIFGPDIRFNGQVRLGHHPRFCRFGCRFFNRGLGLVYAYPYYVPYYVYADDYGAAMYNESPEPEPPAPTIFERRGANAWTPDSSRYGEHYLDGREQARAAPPAAEPKPEVKAQAAEPQPTTVLVFRDGHTLEVQNYAIVGPTLINLGGGPRKIALADLDLQATVKTNDDRGVQFSVPGSAQ